LFTRQWARELKELNFETVDARIVLEINSTDVLLEGKKTRKQEKEDTRKRHNL
jgi:hypothetical protein